MSHVLQHGSVTCVFLVADRHREDGRVLRSSLWMREHGLTLALRSHLSRPPTALWSSDFGPWGHWREGEGDAVWFLN